MINCLLSTDANSQSCPAVPVEGTPVLLQQQVGASAEVHYFMPRYTYVLLVHCPQPASTLDSGPTTHRA